MGVSASVCSNLSIMRRMMINNVSYFLQFKLLSMMLANVPEKRPTTFGIRARPPLSKFRVFEDSSLQDWHFELPTKNNSNILRKSSSESA